ncbi:MAG: EF-P 5-aminopentanol modification-associated protein YfmF [Bacillota bacterium]
MAGDFLERKLRNGVTLHVWPTPKFKTTTMQAFLHRPLQRSTAAETALLPMVLRRGTRRFPKTIDLWRHLDHLYGAELGGDILKKGERQIVNLGVSLANERYLGTTENLLEQGLALLSEALLDPARDGEAFRADYVEQEKDNLKRQIESLFNDKIHYSMNRCYQEMCEGEPFAVYKYGLAEDVAAITPEGLYRHYADVLRTSPMDLFVAGDVDPDGLQILAERYFDFQRTETRVPPPTQVRSQARSPMHRVVEPQDVTQGKLCIGFRTGVTRADRDWYPLVVGNGVMGGYAHSKLFTYVREKASLCYYAYSSLEGLKGVGLIYSGIEVANYQKALDLIQKQVEDTQAGHITDYELDATKKAIIRDLQSGEDSPEQKMAAALDMVISGASETTEERIARFRNVTRDQAAAGARHIQLDTIYFLRDQAPDRQPAEMAATARS